MSYLFTSKKAFKDATYTVKNDVCKNVPISSIREAIAKSEGFRDKTAYMDALDQLTENPFEDKELVDTLLFADYGGAGYLQGLVAHLYNSQWKVNLSNACSSLDDQHFGWVMQMIRHYKTFGESDPIFMDVARKVVQNKRNNIAWKEGWDRAGTVIGDSEKPRIDLYEYKALIRESRDADELMSSELGYVRGHEKTQYIKGFEEYVEQTAFDWGWAEYTDYFRQDQSNKTQYTPVMQVTEESTLFANGFDSDIVVPGESIIINVIAGTQEVGAALDSINSSEERQTISTPTKVTVLKEVNDTLPVEQYKIGDFYLDYPDNGGVGVYIEIASTTRPGDFEVIQLNVLDEKDFYQFGAKSIYDDWD